MIGLFFLSACSKDNINYYPSKEEALEKFIQSEGIKGNIDLITTMNGEELLVIQQDTNSYFVGELLEDKKGFAVNRISENVFMELGGSWELKTNAKYKYTIYFEKEQESQDFYPLSNVDYYIALVEGYQIIKEDSIFINTIKDVKALKD